MDSKGLRLTLLQVTLEGARTVSKCFQPGATDHFSLRGTTEKARERYFWHSDGAMRLGGWEVCVSVCSLVLVLHSRLKARAGDVAARVQRHRLREGSDEQVAVRVRHVGSWQSVLALGTFVRAAASRSRERRRAHFVHVSASELKAVLAESLCDPEWEACSSLVKFRVFISLTALCDPEWEACARAKKLSEKSDALGRSCSRCISSHGACLWPAHAVHALRNDSSCAQA